MRSALPSRSTLSVFAQCCLSVLVMGRLGRDRVGLSGSPSVSPVRLEEGNRQSDEQQDAARKEAIFISEMKLNDHYCHHHYDYHHRHHYHGSSSSPSREHRIMYLCLTRQGVKAQTTPLGMTGRRTRGTIPILVETTRAAPLLSPRGETDGCGSTITPFGKVRWRAQGCQLYSYARVVCTSLHPGHNYMYVCSSL